MSNWALIDHLTDYLQRPRMGDPRHPTLWPSEATAIITNKHGDQEVVGKCRRACWLRYAKSNFQFSPTYSHLATLLEEVSSVEIPVDRYMLWIWRAGELYEDYIISMAKTSGVYIGDQVGIYIPKHNISGKIDLTVINPENSKLSDVEVKSVYGFGANVVLGTPGQRKQGNLGTPRDSNLMQIALYHWWDASKNEQYEDSRLLYGARDTGRYAEYRVRTEEEDGVVKVFYRGESPNVTTEVESPITINSIVQDGYKFIEDHLQAGEMPDRDFDLSYDDEKLHTLNERGELSRKDSEQLNKIKDRVVENRQRVLDGQEPKKQYKAVEKGDWQCRFCKNKNFCYNQDGTPRV